MECRFLHSDFSIYNLIFSGGETSSGGCKAVCMFGGTCVDGKCVCAPGYTGEFCTERKLTKFRCTVCPTPEYFVCNPTAFQNIK